MIALQVDQAGVPSRFCQQVSQIVVVGVDGGGGVDEGVGGGVGRVGGWMCVYVVVGWQAEWIGVWGRGRAASWCVVCTFLKRAPPHQHDWMLLPLSSCSAAGFMR